jgi:hypothetical protein
MEQTTIKRPVINSSFRGTIDFINFVWNTYFKVREIHWNERNRATHKLADDVMSSLIDYQDFIMECNMGMFGRPGYNIFNIINIEVNDLKELLTALRTKTLEFKSSIPGTIYSGLTKILDDLVADINKWIYLSENK